MFEGTNNIGTRVLFLCARNAARSQMAEALLRALSGDRCLVFSAALFLREGDDSGDVDPLACHVMAERGINMIGQRAKSLASLRGCPDFDDVIMLCERTQRFRMHVQHAARHHYWPLPDPNDFRGIEEVRLAKYRALRNALEARISLWLAGHAHVDYLAGRREQAHKGDDEYACGLMRNPWSPAGERLTARGHAGSRAGALVAGRPRASSNVGQYPPATRTRNAGSA